MSEQGAADKSHEPSSRKLEKARQKGEIARSSDLITAAAYTGFLFVLAATGSAAILATGEAMMVMLARSSSLSEQVFSGPARPLMTAALRPVFQPLSFWFVVPSIAAIAAIFAQRAFVFTPSKLQFKLSRVSVLSNAKNKFGPSGLFEFFKSFSKLALFTLCLGVFLKVQFPTVAEALHYRPEGQLVLVGRLSLQFVLIVVLVMISIGVLDYFWQFQHHLQKNRMSHQEMKDEHKEAEGDPHLKQERRARAQQAASHQLVAEVKQADVLIVNPTHYSVALKWSRRPDEAPICVAKGIDEIAMQMRGIAQDCGVPIHADPPTARALHANLQVGEQIHESHFRAVAVAIRFADDMRRKASKLS